MLYLDLETRSPLDLKKVGSYRYAEQCQILLCAYAIDEGPVSCWDCWHDPDPPAELRAALKNHYVIAHNAMFDRVVLRACYPDLCPALDCWQCSMAQAYAHGLPGALKDLGKVLGLPEELRKLDAEGERLVRLFCKRDTNPDDYPDKWLDFILYATRDVEALREIVKRLPRINYKGDELWLWHVDQRINDRGLYVDQKLVEAAIEVCEVEKAKIDARIVHLTEGRVERATQRDRLLAELPDVVGLTKDAVTRALAQTTDPVQRELLELRQRGARSSTAKYERLRAMVGRDGRVRGLFQFAGGQRTGRWAGRGIQPQNLPRPSRPPKQVEAVVEALRGGYLDLVDPDPIDACVDATRGALCAPPGSRLVVADWSNIESRMLAFLAGEKAKLRAFRAMDAGTGPDIYRMVYARCFGGSLEQADRQAGKVIDLASQYGGGVGAFQKHAQNYGLDLHALVEPAMRIATVEQVRAAEKLYKKMGSGNKKVFIACDVLKRIWRDQHPAIVALWKSFDHAVMLAMAGKKVKAGRCVFELSGKHLLVRLPSERCLLYPNIRRDDEANEVTYNKAPSWHREPLWYGLLTENITQAAARDVLRRALLVLDGVKHLPVVLHSHDEIACEVVNGNERHLAELCAIMETPPGWADGLPLKAKGYVAQRYRKE